LRRPEKVCLVPEKRRELTTEGGLDLFPAQKKLAVLMPLFRKKKIEVSFFIDEVRELPDHLNFPIIVLAQEKELKKYEGFFESTKGVICMKYSKGAVLSKIQELIKKLKQERK
jgi:pyridoxine 5'-phosphate synthase PdxJ